MMLFRVVIPWTILLRTCLAQQDFLSQLPRCAVQCFGAALPTTTCSPTNISCLCLDTPFLETVAACNAGNCTVVETLQSTNLTYAACGVPIRSQGDIITGTAACFGGVAWAMVLIRLIDRHISARVNLGWDDLSITLAGLCSIAMTIPGFLAVEHGFGTDIWGLTPDQITNSLRVLYVAYPFYMLTEAFCQVSILTFYLRIMVEKKIVGFVKGFIVFVAAFGIANTFCMIFSSWPIRYFWDGWKGDMVAASAINMNLFSFIRGGIEIGVDLVILCLPLPMLAKLHMSLQKKIHIMSMFCIGFVITGVSCARLHSLVQFANTSNPTYDNTPTIYWCVIEADLFVVVACMPSIHAVLSRMWSSRDATNRSGYDRSDKSSYFNRSKRSENSSNNHPLGGISKSTEVSVYHTKRADESDVELVERTSRPKDLDQTST